MYSTDDDSVGIACPDDVEEADWNEFLDFFDQYVDGQFLESPPVRPRLVERTLAARSAAREARGEAQEEEPDVEDISLVSPGNARQMWEFLKRWGFIPAPIARDDMERQRLIRAFGLHDFSRQASLDRVCALAKSVFNADLSAISAQLPDRQIILAECSWVPRNADGTPGELPRKLALSCSMCPHAIVGKTGRGTVIHSTQDDWRFKANPYVKGNLIGFYCSEQILLPTPVSELDTSSTAGSGSPRWGQPPSSSSGGGQQKEESHSLHQVGVLCVISSKPRPQGSVTAEDRAVLKDLAAIAAREIQLGAEMVRKAKQEDQQAFVGSLIRSSSITTPSNAQAAATAIQNLHTTPLTEHLDSAYDKGVYAPSVRKIRDSLGVSTCTMLDVRLSQRKRAMPFSPGVSESRTSSKSNVAAKVLASIGFPGIDERMKSSSYLEALERAAQGIEDKNEVLFVPEELARGLVPEGREACRVLVARLPGTADELVFLILASMDPLFDFRDFQDLSFASQVASICLLFLAQTRILEADRAKLRFVSHISHECRTPLHSIASHLDLVREELTQEEHNRFGRILDVADVSLNSLKEILDDALDLSKLTHVLEGGADGGGAMFAVEEASLSDLVVDTTNRTWDQYSRTLRATLAGDESPTQGRPPVTTTIDVAPRAKGWIGSIPSSILRRVVMNLVSNALKYTPRGSIRVSVREETGEQKPNGETEVTITCTDTGLGMSEEFILSGKATMPFVQADPFSSGAGLGLSMVNSMVRSLHGRLTLESELGAGSTISVTLPLRLSRDGAASQRRTLTLQSVTETAEQLNQIKLVDGKVAARPTRPKPLARTPSFKATAEGASCTVLVAEDNAVARNVLLALLKKKGVKTTPAVDGQDAIDQYKKTRPRLVLMDIQMPKKDGFEATREIRQLEIAEGIKPAMIVALTSQSDDATLRTAFDSWIVKGGTAITQINKLLEAQGLLAPEPPDGTQPSK